MKRPLAHRVLCLLVAVGAAGGGGAGIGRAADEVPIGPRAIALGNAYTAIAEDATAIFWNPAGIPRIGNQEITGTHANLFGTGIRDDYLAFVLPFSPSYAIAADWYHTGFDDGELGFGDSRFDLAYGLKLRDMVSVGLNAKYLARDTRLDDQSIRQGSGFGFDAGILVTPLERVRLGATVHDVFGTEMQYFGGHGTAVLYPRSYRLGAAVLPLRNGLVTVDLGDGVHAGAEYSPADFVSFRGGLDSHLEGAGEPPTVAMGVGLRAGVFRFDYALAVHPTLGETSHFGLSLGFNFKPGQLRIERVEARDVFSSLQKVYAREPIGTVRVRNMQNRPITARVSVLAPDLMDAATEEEIVLRPRATLDLPLHAVMSEKALARTGDRRVPLTVGVSDASRRLPRVERRTTQVVAYGRGAIQWSAGVEQAAAFVTAQDPAVMGFAREACRPVALAERSGFPNRNIGFAAAIVDALGSLGVAYVPDPQSPFHRSSATPGYVDTVHYPRETLAELAGDCDDTSVLLAALLESVGVPTAFVDVPGHIFILAGTGVHERNRPAMGLEERLIVVADHQLWIPIETTVIGSGFAQAWRDGADAYASWASRGRVSVVNVESAQARYEPAVLPDSAGTAPPRIDATSQEARLRDDAGRIAGWRSDYLASHFGSVERDLAASTSALNEVAHVYFQAGDVEEARSALERALANDPSSARLRNNLANTYAASGDARRAAAEYAAAVASDSFDVGIRLNWALLRYSVGDSLESGRIVAKAMALDGGYRRACELLGLPASAPTAGGESRTVSEEEARALLRRATRAAAARSDSSEPPSIGDLLYWKD